MAHKVLGKIDYPKTREFADEKYDFVGAETRKVDANRRAKALHARKYKVRIVYRKASKVYLIYARYKRPSFKREAKSFLLR